MPHRKMLPPLPESNESPHGRFKRFAKSVLAVPKSEVVPEQVLAKLEAEKRYIDTKLSAVRRELSKRNRKKE